jgi:hypothetical protein
MHPLLPLIESLPSAIHERHERLVVTQRNESDVWATPPGVYAHGIFETTTSTSKPTGGFRRIAAEKEYSTQRGEYAQRVFSDEGQRNGLYWKSADGEPQSPVGPLVAAAVPEGNASSRESAPTPYRGYYYHILTRQGKNGPGGAKDYIVNGKMPGGFAFVAYPAEYRSSGVMTFIVNEDGVVYQRDLGRKTDALAKAMKEYNPDSNWQKAKEQQEETAGNQKTK